MIRACGIDIGSNSFRLLVAEVREGRLYPLAHDLVTVRLGEGLGLSGRLAPQAVLRAEAALTRFVETMDAYRPECVRACATHAVRVAGNKDDFLQRIKEQTGLRIEVLSGEEEARLALSGVLSALPEDRRRYPLFLADVGGGSTEIILQVTARSEPRLISLPLGAVGLTEEFGADHEAMCEKIRMTFAPALRSFTVGDMVGHTSLLVASGGTVTSLAALALGLDRYDAQRVQNFNLDPATLHSLYAGLVALSPRDRNDLPGLSDGRGEIIVAGAIILQELRQALASPSLLVSDAGLLEGILLSGAADS
ncbi:MAG: Ppx/GppA family phosphatase [Desulfobulbaceae bacterium]|nr:Ppx/GppA family phosphatase [Desulfobulbaceae bacterium]HIJ89475.1 Ppx/GppA family phosphatase [Deltaproteobacteria bacterium]